MSAQLKCIARYIQLFSLRSGSALPAFLCPGYIGNAHISPQSHARSCTVCTERNMQQAPKEKTF